MSWTAVYPTTAAEYDNAELRSSKLTTARHMDFTDACWTVATICSRCAFVNVLVFSGLQRHIDRWYEVCLESRKGMMSCREAAHED